jgi:GNAT superfamily N-acetyltransferase
VPITAPEPLTATHDLSTFRCAAQPSLEDWLKRRALANQESHASRTFVVTDNGGVAGYYCLAAGAVQNSQATGAVRRNMPDPIPVIVLGRLAVHTDYAGQGIGAGLLKDAVLRALRLSNEVGARAMLCHAIDAQAAAFYRKYGFVESPTASLTMFLRLDIVPAPDHALMAIAGRVEGPQNLSQRKGFRE